MKAVVLPKFGAADLLEVKDVEMPETGPGQVLVRVVASGVNPVDAKLRADGSWAQLSPPVILGYDVSGVVEAVGPGGDDFAPGDEVYFTPEIFGNPFGSYAQYTVAQAGIVAPKPKGLSFTDAAAIPLAGGTAWEAVIRRLRIRAGETVLIHSGAGGVGSFAVQFAKAAGARVIATASAGNRETLLELGADVAVDYKEQDAAEAALEQTDGKGVDAAFDISGENRVSRCLPAVRPFGRVAYILPPEGDLTLSYQKNITLHGVFLTRERARLEEMRPIFERGLAKPIVDQVLPLAEVAEAHKRLETEHGRGKIVLSLREA
ncbi:MAG: zinc-binding dehydrogenase [Desulfobacterales bacterium]|nr:zinc-binding dehydrogenase [Desulfobacterales bacterium]